MYSIIIVFLLLLLICIPPFLNRNTWVYSTSNDDPKFLQTYVSQSGWQLDPLETAPGIVLPGLIRLAKDSSSTWVLFLPGNGGGQLEGGQRYLQRLAPSLQNSIDWNLAVWTMRGYDGAPGTQQAEGFRADYLSIYRHLGEEYGVKPGQIHLVGFSFGTDLALQLAAELAGIGASPASISLLSTQGMTAANWRMRRNVWYSRWLIPDRYDLTAAFKLINSPVLIIEAENDLQKPVDYLINALDVNSYYLELPGGDHGSTLTHSAALRAVRDWIKTYDTPTPIQQATIRPY